MSIGQPISRLDGRPKVTGQARYTADTAVEGILYAVLVPSTIPSGMITTIDTHAAEASPGVVHIFTHRNTPRLANATSPPLYESILPLQDDRVLYEGQAVAFVVADTLERATEAARLVRVVYRDEPFNTDFLAELDRAEPRPSFGVPPDAAFGDVDRGLSEGAVTVEGVYLTADRHHNAMEPFATLAIWRDGELLIYDSVQGVVRVRDVIAQIFQVEPARVRVVSEFVGGGFGYKGNVWAHEVLAAMAARELARPVKLVLTRSQSYTSHGYQPASRQTVTLAARRDGTLTGMRHDSIVAGSIAGDHVEPTGGGRWRYTPARRSRRRTES